MAKFPLSPRYWTHLWLLLAQYWAEDSSTFFSILYSHLMVAKFFASLIFMKKWIKQLSMKKLVWKSSKFIKSPFCRERIFRWLWLLRSRSIPDINLAPLDLCPNLIKGRYSAIFTSIVWNCTSDGFQCD